LDPAKLASVTTAPTGFETVTYLIDGIFQHHDSNGGGGLITDGDTQWMTAGQDCNYVGMRAALTGPSTRARAFHPLAMDGDSGWPCPPPEAPIGCSRALNAAVVCVAS